ncbi:MAG TPA: hypothetical protein VGB55_04135 [Tepidisphaeraceae bacterium]
MPIQAFVLDRYEAWQFTSRFDQVSEVLFPAAGTLWTPDAARVDANKLLGELLAVSPSRAKAYYRPGPNLVLFVRSGKTSDRPWLAFACMTRTGLEVYSFERGNRHEVGYDRLFGIWQFFGLDPQTDEPEFVADRVSEVGDAVVADVRINGGRNQLSWSIAAAPSAGRRSNMAYASQLVVASAQPRTGWVSGSAWWPNMGDVELVEGSPAPAEVPAINGALAVSFVSDGRIAVVAPNSLAIVSPEGKAPETTKLPEITRPEIAAFSPNGRWCYLSEGSGKEFLLATFDGTTKPLGNSAGIPNPFYVDDEALIVHDNTRIRRFDCFTGALIEEPEPDEHVSAFVRAKDTVVYTTNGSLLDRLRVQRGNKTHVLPDIQGRHQISLSPDGKWLAVKGQSGISVFDVEAGVAVWEHDMNNDLHTARSRIKWAAGNTVSAAAGNRYVYVWSVKAPRWAARFPHGRTGFWPDVAISEDGKSMAASAAGSPNIAYWNDLSAATQPAR